MRVTFLLLLFALSAFGQPSPLNRRAMAIAGLATTTPPPFNPTNISPRGQVWWVSSDTASNTAVTTWPDRITGLILTNGNAATRPTNNSTFPGVFFRRTGTQLLTNNPSFPGTTVSNSTLFVLAPGSSGAGDLLATIPGGLSPVMYISGGAFHIYDGAADGAGPTVPNLTLIDVVLLSYRAGATYRNVWYTNGVVWPTTNTTVFWAAGWQYKSLGNGADGYYNGYLTELFHVTNLWWTPTIVSNLHYYVTNAYHFSP